MTTGNRRRSRKPRVSGLLSQSPWKALRYHHSPFELLNADAIESIHQAGLSILQESGMAILSENARRHYAEAGFEVNTESNIVRFESVLIEALVAKAPSAFTLCARNPEKNIKLGDGGLAFASVGGPA